MWGMAEPTVHDLPAEADALQAVELRIDSIGDGEVLEPHRHAYHELIWVREGSGRHLIDEHLLQARGRRSICVR